MSFSLCGKQVVLLHMQIHVSLTDIKNYNIFSNDSGVF